MTLNITWHCGVTVLVNLNRSNYLNVYYSHVLLLNCQKKIQATQQTQHKNCEADKEEIMVTMSVMAQSEQSNLVWFDIPRYLSTLISIQKICTQTPPYTSFCSYFSHCRSRKCVHCSEYSLSSRADQSIERPVIVFPKLLTASEAKACRAPDPGEIWPCRITHKQHTSTHTHTPETQKNIHNNIPHTHGQKGSGRRNARDKIVSSLLHTFNLHVIFCVCVCLIQWLVFAFWSGGLACVTTVSNTCIHSMCLGRIICIQSFLFSCHLSQILSSDFSFKFFPPKMVSIIRIFCWFMLEGSFLLVYLVLIIWYQNNRVKRHDWQMNLKGGNSMWVLSFPVTTADWFLIMSQWKMAAHFQLVGPHLIQK